MSIFKQPSLPGVPLRNLGFSFDRFKADVPYRHIPGSGFVRGMVAGFEGKGLQDLWSHMFFFGKELEFDLEHNRVHRRSDGETLEGIFLGLAYPVEDLPKGSNPRMEIARIVSTLVESYLQDGKHGTGSWKQVDDLAQSSGDPDIRHLFISDVYNPRDKARFEIMANALAGGHRALFAFTSTLGGKSMGKSMGNLDETLWAARYEHANG